MAVTYDQLMALRPAETTQRYTSRDTMLYALGVGMGADPTDEAQLPFVYEKGLKALPTLALVLAIPARWVAESGLDYTRVVHGEQAAEFHAPIMPEGEISGTLRITNIIDKGPGKGALVCAERVLTDSATGTKLATVRQTIFARGDGGIGGPAQSQPPVHELPARAPDGMVILPTIPQQALIYRLSGDYNPLHAAPAVAKQAGFAKPILHGLATFGVAAHALLKSVCDYNPDRLAAIAGRFTAPVFPGESLVTEYWVDSGTVSFRTRIEGRDAVAINNGCAEVRAT